MTKPMTKQVLHPMMKLQAHVRSLVESNLIQPTDQLWKIAFLYGDKWGYWKKELMEFGFNMQDSINDLLIVESWEEE